MSNAYGPARRPTPSPTTAPVAPGVAGFPVAAGAPLPPGMSLQNAALLSDAARAYGNTNLALNNADAVAQEQAFLTAQEVQRRFRDQRAAALAGAGTRQMSNSPSATIRAGRELGRREGDAVAANVSNLNQQLVGNEFGRLQADQAFRDTLTRLAMANAMARGDASALLGQVVF